MAVLAAGGPSVARAQEPWLLTVEGDVAWPAGEPQSRLFGPGPSGAAGLYRPFGSYLALGLRLRGTLLLDSDAPEDEGRVDPGNGGLGTLSLAVRLRPLASSDDPRRAVGPWVEAAAGGGLTGDLVRAAFEAGLGWVFDVGPVGVGPALRYQHVLQPDSNLDGRDAHVLMAGIEVVLLDARAEPPPPPAPPPPGDRDHDGILDPDDACPDRPEDADGFEDEDGCPDPDNDQDGIADADDQCPNDPEDVDGFEDEDGCPDPDNDQDGILDADDECPNEPEVVNGIDDGDGCPDEGLIEFVDDRIVIDDTVLFAFDRAYVRPRANPILQAIMTLWRQHPEWEKVRIEGHTDIRGTAEYNQRLSERRANAVMEALIERGMPRDMLEAVGYGETRPLNRGTREATHRRNRRVEFVVLSRREVEVEPGEQPEPEVHEMHLLEEDR